MAIFKCKICGGSMGIGDDVNVATCEYCGTKQTIPSLSDEKRASLYDRANHLRRNNEYDKAMSIYEQILAEDKTDVEAYWSVVLCRFGVDYVEDPSTGKRKPTINRTQTKSILQDDDYKYVIEHADIYQKEIFEADAREIDRIQREILSIARNEEPYDVFISYKEKTGGGSRTQSSVVAQDLYDRLTKEGYRVFFSRLSLEDKIGQQYEPYIYAALNSAKVMLLIGTNIEEFIAPWVKNEWLRFLLMMKEDKEKVLIPCYKDIEPYDLPGELLIYQCQDMGKIGFEQDLIRGISKIIDKKKQSSEHYDKDTNANSLLIRARLFVEDGDYTSAINYCNRVLDKDPKCGEAYLLLYCTDMGYKKIDQMSEDIDNYVSSCEERCKLNKNFERAMEYGDNSLKSIIQKIQIKADNNYHHHLDKLYSSACDEIENTNSINGCFDLAERFKQIENYKDSKDKMLFLLKKTEGLIDVRKSELKEKQDENIKQQNIEESERKSIENGLSDAENTKVGPDGEDMRLLRAFIAPTIFFVSFVLFAIGDNAGLGAVLGLLGAALAYWGLGAYFDYSSQNSGSNRKYNIDRYKTKLNESNSKLRELRQSHEEITKELQSIENLERKVQSMR